jgi:hypothetical protein
MFMLLPLHLVKNIRNGSVTLHCRRRVDKNGSVFKTRISGAAICPIANSDMAIVYVPGSPSFRDVTKFLGRSKGSREGVLLYRTKEGEIKKFATMYCDENAVQNMEGKFPGYLYQLGEDTFKGLCGSILVSRSVQKCILGFHVGGRNKIGGACALNSESIMLAIDYLEAKPGVLSVPSAGSILANQYGVNIKVSEVLHAKSPVNYLPEGSSLEFLGETIGRVTPVSQVEETEISQTVTKVMGVPNMWGSPKFGPQRWKPWQTSLVPLSNPTLGFDLELINWAVQDYISPLLDIVNKNAYTWLRPLTSDENVNGIDGLRFIDALKANTSVGFPLAGPKDIYLTKPVQTETHQNCRQLDAQFWEEAERIKEVYRRGERAYPIFKATLKDEPTKTSKDKVRVFQAAPLALQLLVRQYFLPLARLLSLYPLKSECGVGVNAHGPEWDQLARAMIKYGKDRIFAGDYSKYDLRLPAQITIAAFDVLITLAQESGNYTSDDIVVMKGIVADVVNPLVAYNGDLLMFFGSNPSGQNLTVYINSIGNSLILRSAFKALSAKCWFPPRTFREHVSICTYGDDVKGSVHVNNSFFNHVTVANWLQQSDIVFTMPDKESTPTPFMSDSEADFLKRKNRYSDDLHMYVGLLDEMSIFKSLHSILKSKSVTNREQCVSNIGGALREFFFYGEEKYESRRSELQEVAKTHQLFVPELEFSYQECLLRHKEKYSL